MRRRMDEEPPGCGAFLVATLGLGLVVVFWALAVWGAVDLLRMVL